MGYIYKITNDINNLSYIGQTKKTVDYRFKEHLRQAKYELKGIRPLTHFHSAINKYGATHFHVKTLEQCDDNLLDEREKYWIEYYDTYINGYNSTLGGQFNSIEKLADKTTKGEKQVIQYDLNGNFIQIFNSAAEAAKTIDIDVSYIRLVCNPNTANKSAGGFQWRYYIKNYPLQIEAISGKSGRVGQPVNQYDLKGNYLNTFSSIQNAAQVTKQTARNITFACEKKQKRAGMFQWRYATDIDLPTNLIAERLLKYCNPYIAIEQLNKQGELINTWNSVIDAAETLELDAKKIGLTCEKQQQSYSGFKWQYKI